MYSSYIQVVGAKIPPCEAPEKKYPHITSRREKFRELIAPNDETHGYFSQTAIIPHPSPQKVTPGDIFQNQNGPE